MKKVVSTLLLCATMTLVPSVANSQNRSSAIANGGKKFFQMCKESFLAGIVCQEVASWSVKGMLRAGWYFVGSMPLEDDRTVMYFDQNGQPHYKSDPIFGQ